MFKWLFGLLTNPRRAAARERAALVDHPTASRAAVADNDAAPPEMSAMAREFLGELVAKEEARELNEFSADGQLFLSAVVELISENRIEIPLLPQAALEIPRLLEKPDVGIPQLAAVLEQDPSLSVAVLRVANSAAFGSAHETASLRQAIVRLGLHRLRALLVTAHLESKVLHAGVFQEEARWLTTLSRAMAEVAVSLAPALSTAPDVLFTKGMLWHLEHLLVLTTVSTASARQRRRLAPEAEVLQEAFFRFGPTLRELAARAWDLRPLLIDAPDSYMSLCMIQIRRRVVAKWCGLGLPEELAGLPEDRLHLALERV